MHFCLLSVLSALGALSNVANAAETSTNGDHTTSTNGDHDHDHTTTSTNGDLCYASCTTNDDGLEVCKFHAAVDLHAGELGYYQFEECGDKTNPTLGMEVGKTYEFVQTDRSNYYHPLGLAYYPDGAHAEADELEPGIVPPGSSSTCDADMSCPAPMYFIDGKYQGTYSNIAELQDPTTGEDNFGLDEYEPLFFHPLPEWVEYGTFSIFLKFDEDTDYTKDIFYFCHIHQYMTGRIKLLKNGEPIQKDTHLPDLGYNYDQPAEHDLTCGTYGLHEFQLPHEECPEQFVCDVDPDNEEMSQFAGCIDSMNCAMMSGMTTGVVEGTQSEAALFLHQMIPHHQNAVNMAKALMKTEKVNCDDLTGEEDACALEVILREIINGQNHQIQVMRGLLDSMDYPQENDCTVAVGVKNAAVSVTVFTSASVAALVSSLCLML